ncbi:MAG: T9SS type A sorting domain-containing protein [Crocinitomicaceae bacterium]|nr:T9SS type A sorting domain-containing protein [Crocinitomicaceae bacterium]
MKHFTLALALGLFVISGMAQSAANSGQQLLQDVPQLAPALRTAVPMPTKAIADFSDRPQQPLEGESTLDIEHVMSREMIVERQVIGYTQYDLQSNAAIDDRMAGGANAISAAWTMSLELTPFSDRGTGYNFHDGTAWAEIAYERIESTRIGWPSIVHTASGREVVVSHPGIDTPLHMAWRDAGTGSAWSEASVPSEIAVGKLWPRMAAGGEDGNSLHVICVTTPEANGGAFYGGQDGALVYYRSQDGGDTWDIIDHIFPEADSTQFFGFSGDTYAIHARGNTVALASFNDFSDSFVMISQDNGDTWEKQLLVDFPVDMYEVDMGLPEIGEDYNEDGLFQEFFNADGAGDVHIDAYGQVHVSFGSMYYMDADTIDGTTSYFPGTNGLAYWNESMGPDSAQIIAYSFDYDESGTLDFEDEIAAYFVGCAAFPSMATDASGAMYITYSAIMENFSTGAQNYRHQFVVYSTDGGVTWNTEDACDLTPDIDFDGYEAVFGSIAPDVVEGKLEIIYQRDFEPGLHVRGDEDPIDINDIVHLRVPTDDLGDCSDVEFEDWVGIAEAIDPADINLYPNPADDQVELVINRPGAHQVDVWSATGQRVLSMQTTAMVQRLETSQWAPGIYLVNIAQGEHHTVVRLAVQ